MYGKIFDSMYDGTLYGQWEALVTFQQLIVLCDADGIVDMTPPAIAARTSIPLEIITKGLATLESQDPYSRTPGQEGRRIELIDAHRPWGWHIVNHDKYQHMQDADTIRAQTRERVRKHRAQKEAERYGNAGVTEGNGSLRHTNTNTNTNIRTSKPLGSSEKPLSPEEVEIFLTLNDKTEYPVSKALVAEWGQLYPAVDVPQTLREIKGWFIANPSKRKTKTGILRCVNSWLSREQNKG